MTAKFPGRPQGLRVRLLPLGGAVARSAAEGVIWVRTPSVKPCRACQLSQRESPWHDGKASGQTAKLTVSPEPLPLAEVSPQVTERVHAVRNSPSHLALLDASPLGDGALDMAGKLPDKLQSFRHARGSLSEGAGKTVRFCLREFVPCSTWNNFTVRRRWLGCAPYIRYTRPSPPGGQWRAHHYRSSDGWHGRWCSQKYAHP